MEGNKRGCFWDSDRGEIHHLFYLLVSVRWIVTGSSPGSHSSFSQVRNTAGRTLQTWPGWLYVRQSWKQLVMGWEGLYCLSSLLCSYIDLHPHVCGQYVATYATNCNFHYRLCHPHLNHCCVPNKTTFPCPDILWRASRTMFWYIYRWFDRFIDETVELLTLSNACFLR